MNSDAGNCQKQFKIVSHTRVPRARRYEINTTMRYRLRGEKQWREGIVKNISNTGVLLCTDTSLELGSSIEVRFSLPVHLQGESAAGVLCVGSVIRSLKSEEPGEAAMTAAKIEHWRLIRKRDTEQE